MQGHLAAVTHFAIAVAVPGVTPPDGAGVTATTLRVRELGAREAAAAAVFWVQTDGDLAAVRGVLVAVAVRLITDGDIAGVLSVATRGGVLVPAGCTVDGTAAKLRPIHGDAGPVAELLPRRAL